MVITTGETRILFKCRVLCWETSIIRAQTMGSNFAPGPCPGGHSIGFMGWTVPQSVVCEYDKRAVVEGRFAEDPLDCSRPEV